MSETLKQHSANAGIMYQDDGKPAVGRITPFIIPDKMVDWPDAGLVVGHRPRRWPDTKQASVKGAVFVIRLASRNCKNVLS